MKPKDEEQATKAALYELGFKVSSVLPELMKDFRFRSEPTVGWMTLSRYALLKDVIAEAGKKDCEFAPTFAFVSAVVRMHPITGSRICLFKTEKGWGSLVATEYGNGPGNERSLVSIMSGDGFGPNCHFAVVSKGAHR